MAVEEAEDSSNGNEESFERWRKQHHRQRKLQIYLSMVAKASYVSVSSGGSYDPLPR